MKPMTIVTVVVGIFVFFAVYGYLDAKFTFGRTPCWHDGCDRKAAKSVKVCRQHHEEKKR